MKRLALYCSGLLLLAGMAGCNGNGMKSGSDTTANSSTTTQMNPNDSSVTTTTTTTTTVTRRRYTGNFVPQATTKYLDLRTNKRVNVKLDTSRDELVNTETNQPVDLIVEPTTHDTIYGQTGTIVNNYIIKDESGYRVDTVRINTVDTVEKPVPVPVPVRAAPGKEKIKGKGSMEKVKEK